MRTSAQQAGDRAEALVAGRLLDAGWQVLGRNVRIGRTELDLVCLDPGPPGALVIVEVRWRRRRDFGLPEESVDRAKWRRVRAAAFRLRDDGRLPAGTPLPGGVALRFDLVVVEPGEIVRHHRYAG